MGKKVLIVGLGLIGSSLALAIKKEHPNVKIIGLDIQKSSEEFALKRGMIDEIGGKLEDVAPISDVILLCSPVETVKSQLVKLSKLPLQSNVLISDVGSVKKEIVDTANVLGLKNFIGGHPMAGSHKSGVSAGDERLFENAYYILTPQKDTIKEKIEELQTLLSGTKAKFVTLESEEHDKITGMLSHLPHVIAAGLVNQSKEFNEQHQGAKRLAAGGFRDLTRIASSDPRMWTDILLNNKEVLFELIEEWQEVMNGVKKWLKMENQEAIFEFFATAKKTRNQMPVHKEGALPAFYDLFVDVPDIPGVIAEVTGILGKHELSLVNLKILETREDIFGILQLTFKRQGDLKRAMEILRNETSYLCYEE
ncbi:prephenate dehydrogenase [Pilibacter termitis]|uniref:Prephenate dehydrogenase n=1 Tax=Pilibacter termitis TaxID=263852 RepID=A0A1T4MR76_9ENTE|nr:prephenate dehydrogenase [Pilibacter termitis]SJZ69326.1 prephenate dehydrogenase [Pilibacter termitis]